MKLRIMVRGAGSWFPGLFFCRFGICRCMRPILHLVLFALVLCQLRYHRRRRFTPPVGPLADPGGRNSQGGPRCPRGPGWLARRGVRHRAGAGRWRGPVSAGGWRGGGGGGGPGGRGEARGAPVLAVPWVRAAEGEGARSRCPCRTTAEGPGGGGGSRQGAVGRRGSSGGGRGLADGGAWGVARGLRAPTSML